MIYLFPGSFGLPEEPTSPAQPPPIDGNPTVSSAGVMYSTLLQLRAHVETEKLERPTLKQLVQRLQKDFDLLQPQIELLEQPTTSKSSSLMTLENKITVLEKRLSTETCRYNSRLNSLQRQLSTMGDQICQFEHSNSNFILWKITSIQLVFESAKLWYLKPARENAPNTRLRSPIFRSHPYGYNFWNYTPMDLQLLSEHGLLSLFPYLLENMMTFCRGRSRRQSRWKCVTNWTLLIPGARQLSPKNYPDQPQLSFLPYQQFETLTSFHIRNSLKKLMATCIMTLCISRFPFLTPQYHLRSLPNAGAFSFNVHRIRVSDS